MSDNFVEDEDYQDSEDAMETGNQQKDRKWVRDLEKRAKSAEQAKAEAEAAKRELAMLKAGLDPESPQGKLFLKAFDGDPTPENVKAFVQEYGLGAQQQEPQNTVPAEELAAHDRLARAASASTAGPDFASEINSAESPEQVIEVLRRAGIAITNEQPGQWRSLV